MSLNKNIKDVKDLLHVSSFGPYLYQGEVEKKPTYRMITRPNFNDNFFNLIKLICGKDKIEDCLFIDSKKKSIFFLVDLNAVAYGLFGIGYVSLKKDYRYDSNDLKSFISFLDKENFFNE